MPIEIHLTEGPNVEGLSDERHPLFVGYSYRGNDLIWRLIEGRKTGTPRTYHLHIGKGSSLVQAEITRFEHTGRETVVDFNYSGEGGRLTISNISPDGKFVHGNIDEAIETVYNFFGNREATGMTPGGCDEYYKD